MVRRIGDYELGEVLGQGGAGIVYAARQLPSGRPAVVKLLLAGREARPEQRRRLQREARALSEVRHPGLVEILDVGEHEGGPWLAMARVDGRSLEDELAAQGEFPWPQVVEWGLALCEALAVVHDAGILHRDLKPANLIRRPSGELVVVDFGLAKQEEIVDSLTLSHTGHALGTPGFWSPEQASGRREVGPESDVYGLGATLFALLTGRPPIQADSLVEFVIRTVNDPPPPARSLQPGLPAWLEAVLARCLAKEPAARFPDMRALARALQIQPTAPSRAPLLLAAGIVGLAGAAAGLILVRGRPSSASDTSSLRARASASPAVRSPSPPSVSPGAVTRFGELMQTGQPAAALEVLKQAAAAGDGDALNELAFGYEHGLWGLPLDQQRALELYRSGAELEEPKAIYNLAVCWQEGRGVGPDLGRALELYRRAAALGDEAAHYNLSVIYERGAPSIGLAPDLERAVGSCRQAAELGYPLAMANLSSYLFEGALGEPDLEGALHWLERAAAAGEPGSQFLLARLLYGGQQVPADHERARRLLNDAARQGHAMALVVFAEMLATGTGGVADVPRARELFGQALRSSDPAAREAARRNLERLPPN